MNQRLLVFFKIKIYNPNSEDLFHYLPFIFFLPYQQAEPEECEGCREGAGIIFGHLNGGSLDSVIQTFDGEICRYEEHPEHCIETLNTWWPVISKIIFSNAAARKVCTAISGGACEAQKYVIFPINSPNVSHYSNTQLHNRVHFRG